MREQWLVRDSLTVAWADMDPPSTSQIHPLAQYTGSQGRWIGFADGSVADESRPAPVPPRDGWLGLSMMVAFRRFISRLLSKGKG